MPASVLNLHRGLLAAGGIAVLVVDDQAVVREVVARLLRCGAVPVREVCTASNISEAIALIAKTRFDVVVLDVDLGGEDGLSLITLLPRSSRVVVLSCRGDASTRSRAASLGAMAFVEKHEPATTLLATVADLAFPRSRGEVCTGSQGGGSQGSAGPSSEALKRADF